MSESEVKFNLENKEKEINGRLTWGKQINDPSKHTKDASCLDCKFPFEWSSIQNLDKGYLKGIQEAPTVNKVGDKYAAVLECPKCSSVCWEHIGIDSLRDIQEWLEDIKNEDK